MWSYMKLGPVVQATDGRMTDGSGEQLTFGSGEPKKVS